ncbi:hypothetical protein AX768_17530 [Burkholderia sp. PAMC 28687]|nr:hypothetical protein AX768_17530 [Burkholderia sp. PAMC 28687]
MANTDGEKRLARVRCIAPPCFDWQGLHCFRVGRTFFLRRLTNAPHPIAMSIAAITPLLMPPLMPIPLRDSLASDAADAATGAEV